MQNQAPLSDVPAAVSERDQTDESLRREREIADSLDDDLALAEQAADAVICRARTRADALLAAVRRKTDQTAETQPSATLRTARAVEDRVLERERVAADDVLRDERAEHVALLSHERETTDSDLSHERSRADHALAVRDEFMGIVSHDLLNMLNAIVVASALIEKEVSYESHVEQVMTSARRILRSASRMHRLVGDLVDVASIEAGALAVSRSTADAAEVVTEAVESLKGLASGSGISIATEIGSPLPCIDFDPARILQVLCNLVNNAIKFTPAHGSVVVRVEAEENGIVFSVSDTGEGIPGDKLEGVFERFVQLTKNDRRGVGLGLYISKCIVRAHGGRIWAQNRVGQGSTFFFTLPGTTV
jgi:signal transduction histidine kinase